MKCKKCGRRPVKTVIANSVSEVIEYLIIMLSIGTIAFGGAWLLIKARANWNWSWPLWACAFAVVGYGIYQLVAWVDRNKDI